MTSTITHSITRTLFSAALALAGTVAGLSLTIAPAYAGPASNYTAKLSTPVNAPVRKVVNGVLWNCAGDACAGAIDGARPLNTCIKVAKSFGRVIAFTTPKGEFTAEQVGKCNTVA